MLEYTTVKQTNKSCEKLFSEEEIAALFKLSDNIHAPVPSFCLSLPLFEHSEKMSHFYTLLCKSCVKVFLRSILEKERADDFGLFSSFTVTKNENDLFSLYTDMYIMRGKTPIFYKRTAQTWLISEERLLDIRAACRITALSFSKKDKKNDRTNKTSEERGKKSRFIDIFKRTKIPRTDDFYLTGNGITLFHNRFAPSSGRVRRSQLSTLFVETDDLTN